MSIGKDFSRCNIVCDRYFKESLKEGVRKVCGSGTKVNFNESSMFPSKFSDDFLKDSENKENLNLFLAQMFIRLHGNNAQQLVVTFKETILPNSIELMNECAINYCSAEEADPRLLRHAINQASNGLKCIVLKQNS